MNRRPMRVGYPAVKRISDIALASVGIVLTLPLQGTIAACVALRMGRPVLFVQTRVGKSGRHFQIVKFRTMRPPASPDDLADAVRLTSFGKMLRQTSLDELPTLYNVLIGTMSLVGPRPLLPEYLLHYTPHQARRHEVRPGVTGLAQVMGRNAVAWEAKLDYDVAYVDRLSMTMDLAILARTARMVLTGAGVSAPGHATMPPFATQTAGGDSGP